MKDYTLTFQKGPEIWSTRVEAASYSAAKKAASRIARETPNRGFVLKSITAEY